MSAILQTDDAWRQLHEAATAPYRKAGRFAWHFARGKLAYDPVFRGMLEHSLVAAHHARVVDIGCGQGLLASLLASMSAMQRQRSWPAHWRSTPPAPRYTGIELMPRDVQRAIDSIGHLEPAPQFECANMCDAAFPACDLVVLFDVLHYVDIDAQQRVLERVREALRAGAADRAVPRPGRLLLRIGDAADRRGFTISQWVDRTVTRARGHRVSPTWGRPLAQWTAALERLGFSVQAMPMSAGTPFANVLLVADIA